ncbi:uncharacterized protein LOC128219753 isoform X2 [Mya arenaria]|uniref:uncharacterized protein LOC128219753 isoform X2 n=1 Tax=Mya arenaria TaxID=6604 RepID=UPI0022E8F94E|nr:uncharacterized protein LOC128219753 isoform X2 [Mya arenaria]
MGAATCFVLFVLCVNVTVLGSHFRGGTLSWTFINETTIQLRYRLSWRQREEFKTLCNQEHVTAQALVGREQQIQCIFGCKEDIAVQTSVCTDFSPVAEEDVSSGQGFITYTSNTPHFELRMFGYSWVSLVAGGRRWSMVTDVNLKVKKPGGRVNNSPTVDIPAIIHFHRGCSHVLKLPVSDIDGDNVRCRKALSNDECGDVCQSFDELILNEDTCTLHYTPSKNSNTLLGFYAIAIQIEDYEGNERTPLSSIPLQFLLKLDETDNCTEPSFLPPTPEHEQCFRLNVGEVFSANITAQGKQKLQYVITSSPIGMQRSGLTRGYENGSHFASVAMSWTPTAKQTNENHILCFYVVDISRISSQVRCIYLPVSVGDPRPLEAAFVSGSEIIVTLNKNFQLPSIPPEVILYTQQTEYVSVFYERFSQHLVRVHFETIPMDANSYRLRIPDGFVVDQLQFCLKPSIEMNLTVRNAYDNECATDFPDNGCSQICRAGHRSCIDIYVCILRCEAQCVFGNYGNSCIAATTPVATPSLTGAPVTTPSSTVAPVTTLSSTVALVTTPSSTTTVRHAMTNLIDYLGSEIIQSHSSSQYDSWSARRAIDDDFGSCDCELCDCCFGSINEAEAWLSIDLGRPHPISTIKLYAASEEISYRHLGGFKIYFANDRSINSSIDDLKFFMAYEDKNTTYRNVHVINFDKVHCARQITVLRHGTLTICELLVYSKDSDLHTVNCPEIPPPPISSEAPPSNITIAVHKTFTGGATVNVLLIASVAAGLFVATCIAAVSIFIFFKHKQHKLLQLTASMEQNGSISSGHYDELSIDLETECSRESSLNSPYHLPDDDNDAIPCGGSSAIYVVGGILDNDHYDSINSDLHTPQFVSTEDGSDTSYAFGRISQNCETYNEPSTDQ